ncbi:hypothetical protein P7K49_036715 [Saguinus oedipus]|uniref:Uncharacterized protein n=1 Tax=Saguinus oedipus TaxID=9490 RepID=A0ABQ9TKX7_SAGOE|nr:hypothetical protein P7K49_036715 [Saguinus oedipus]
MDEDEYDALTKEEKMTFNRGIQQVLRERKKRSGPRAGHSRSCSPGPSPQSDQDWGVSLGCLPGGQQQLQKALEDDLQGAGRLQGASSCTIQGFSHSPSFSLKGIWDQAVMSWVAMEEGPLAPVLSWGPCWPPNQHPQMWLISLCARCLCASVSTAGDPGSTLLTWA